MPQPAVSKVDQAQPVQPKEQPQQQKPVKPEKPIIQTAERDDVVINKLKKSSVANSDETPLFLLLKGNYSPNQMCRVARLLLQKGGGCDPNQVIPQYGTLLHYAIKEIDAAEDGEDDIVEVLLECGADPRKPDAKGYTPFHTAAFSGDTNLLDLLCDHQGDVNCPTERGETPLSLALQESQFKVVKYLAEHCKVDLQNVDGTGNSALHVLVNRGIPKDEKSLAQAKKIALYLMLNGVSVESSNEDGETPFHLAIANQRHDLIDELLKKITDINKTTNDGATPLHIAAEHYNLKMIQKLVNAGAEINCENKLGETAIDLLVYGDPVEAIEGIKYLLSKGALLKGRAREYLEEHDCLV